MVEGRITARPDLPRSGHRLDSVRDDLHEVVANGQMGVDSRGRTRPSRRSQPRYLSCSRRSRTERQPRPNGTRPYRVKRTKLSDAVRPEASVATRATGPAPMWGPSASTNGHGTRSRTRPTSAPTNCRGTNRPGSLTECSGTVTPTSEALEQAGNSTRSAHGATAATRESTGSKSSCVNIGRKL